MSFRRYIHIPTIFLVTYKQLSKPDKKFTADITYGIPASGNCLLTDVADQLHDPSKKINIVDRLSTRLDKGTPVAAATSYLQVIKKWGPTELIIYIDDSDVVKPNGYKFGSLDIVKDGSESTSTKNVYKTGYHVSKACVLTNSSHPVSIFSKIHSSSKKVINLLTQSLSKQRNRELLSLKLQSLPWIAVTMTTRCF